MPSTQVELCRTLRNSGAITKNIEDVMNQVDRKIFVPQFYAERAYLDTPLPIGSGQTISAPHMHGSALGLIYDVMKTGAQPPEPIKFLDVGCGSGYFSALVAAAFPNADVYGVDCFAELVQQTKEHCTAVGGNVARVDARLGDGWKGLPDEAPFDAIHVGAAATSVPPALLKQLKVGGRLVIPVGEQGGMQQLLQVDRLRADTPGDALDMRNFKVEHKALVAFVPLIKKPAEVSGDGEKEGATL